MQIKQIINPTLYNKKRMYKMGIASACLALLVSSPALTKPTALPVTSVKHSAAMVKSLHNDGLTSSHAVTEPSARHQILSGPIAEISNVLLPGQNFIEPEWQHGAIMNADDLTNAIDAETDDLFVIGISYWDTSAQQWISFAPKLPSFLQGSNFKTAPSQIYLVNMTTK